MFLSVSINAPLVMYLLSNSVIKRLASFCSLKLESLNYQLYSLELIIASKNAFPNCLKLLGFLFNDSYKYSTKVFIFCFYLKISE